MVNWTKFLILVFLLVYIEFIVARRGGGSGGRGKGVGRYGGGYRKSGTKNKGFTLTGRGTAWKAGIIAGTFYGSRKYMMRRRFQENREPAYCANFHRTYDSNNTLWGKFICPMDHQSDELEYCCGPSMEQVCCKFFDDSSRTAGVVIGMLLAFGTVSLVLFCCVRKIRELEQKDKASIFSKDDAKQCVPLKHTGGPSSCHTNMGYPSPVQVRMNDQSMGPPAAGQHGYEPSGNVYALPQQKGRAGSPAVNGPPLCPMHAVSNTAAEWDGLPYDYEPDDYDDHAGATAGVHTSYSVTPGSAAQPHPPGFIYSDNPNQRVHERPVNQIHAPHGGGQSGRSSPLTGAGLPYPVTSNGRPPLPHGQ